MWHASYHSDAAPLLSTRKQRDVVAEALRQGLIDVISPAPFDEPTTWAQIASVHDRTYVEAVRTGRPRHLAESQGFRWSPEFATSVFHIWEGHVKACQLALERGLVLHPVSGAHHADREGGGGFCTFNYLVGAGLALLREARVSRVAIIDLDAHQGDGTWRLVQDDERFGLFDIAGGSWCGTFNTSRAVYTVATNAAEYFDHLDRLPGFLDDVQPDLVMYQAGMDPHEQDHVGGIPGMTWDLLRERDRFVLHTLRQRGMPTVVNLAGGYQDDGSTVAGHVRTIEVIAEVLTDLCRGGPGAGQEGSPVRAGQPRP